MQEKLDYDRSRHKDIRINGRKAKMLGYRFVTGNNGMEYVLIKTKIHTNFPRDTVLGKDNQYIIELPGKNGPLIVKGKISCMGSCSAIREYYFEILPGITTVKCGYAEE